MVQDCFEKALRGHDLEREEAATALEEMLSERATPTQMTALLIALAMKGETEDELLGMAQALRSKFSLNNPYGPVEVGLSSSGRRFLHPEISAESVATFPISTAVAFVVAGAGVRVLQHGLRSSLPFGEGDLDSASVLEALGINTRIPARTIARGVEEIGLGFVFEPLPGEGPSEEMERLRFALREIPVPTALNLLVPLLNPGGAQAVVVGVHSEALVETLAQVVARLGIRRACVFHGSDGLDEMTHTGPTTLVEVRDGETYRRRIEPGDFGFPAVPLEDLAGGDARASADILRSILRGEPGPRRHVVLLNAAPGMVCGGKARDLPEGIHLAEQAIDSGQALGVLERLAPFTHGAG